MRMRLKTFIAQCKGAEWKMDSHGIIRTRFPHFCPITYVFPREPFKEADSVGLPIFAIISAADNTAARAERHHESGVSALRQILIKELVNGR